MMFESFRGRSFKDSPGAIYERIQSEYTNKFEFIWVYESIDSSVPAVLGINTRTVKYKSIEYWYHLATSSYIISNCILPIAFSPKKLQKYVQTWHGTPLKKLGLDLDIDSSTNYSTRFVREIYRKEGKRVSFFFSSSSYVSSKLKSAFGTSNDKIIEIGYPKNDLLVQQKYNYDRRKISEELGLDPNKRTILYAPTFRDDEYGKEGSHSNIIDEMATLLGNEYNFLVRGHYYHKVKNDDSFVNVSEYHDINDLFLFSDILITDYSSVIFDFSLLNKPIVFYTPDYDRYVGLVRGLYFDLFNSYSILRCHNLDEVYYSLNNELFNLDALKLIQEDFNGLDDGDASSRAITFILK